MVEVVTVTDLTTLTLTILQDPQCMVMHNLHLMDSETMLIGINLTQHGDQVVTEHSTEVVVLEVVKVLSLYRSFTDERS